jgi:hypothetical protein
MTPKELERNWLSLYVWVRRCVLPAGLILLGLLLIIKLLLIDLWLLNHVSAIFGFFVVYFVLVRGGHLIMIRSLHFDLKKTYGKAYEVHLLTLPSNLRRYNLGFTLARIKRDLIHSARQNKKR